MKRRKTHTQVLRPGLAAVLAERFEGMMPAAAAVKIPSKHHMAEMIRKDLSQARAAWIGQTGTTARYLHGDRRSAARAVAALPHLSYPQSNSRRARTALNRSLRPTRLAQRLAQPGVVWWRPVEGNARKAARWNTRKRRENPAVPRDPIKSQRRLPGGIGRRDGFKIHYP